MITKEEIMSLIYDCCSWQYCAGLKKLFKEHRDEIDLTDDDGMLFKMAVAYKSTELLTTLLDFYKATKLQSNPESLEYKLAYIQLRHMLDDASEAHDVVPEIQAIIESYLTKEEESENEQDLVGFDDIELVASECIELCKSDSASDLSDSNLSEELNSSGSTDIDKTSNLGQESELFMDY